MNCTVACRECDRSCKRTLAHDRPGGGEDASGLEAGLRAGLEGLGRCLRVVADPFDTGGRIADWLAAQAGGERRGLPLVPPPLLW